MNKLACTVISCVVFLVGVSTAEQSEKRGGAVVLHASGTFEVKLNPQEDKGGDPSIGRMSLEKVFHGDLEGTSKGQMLTAMTDVKGSAGYVAI